VLDNNVVKLMMYITIIICVFFACFTAQMFTDNVKMAIDDTSTIDRKLDKRAAVDGTRDARKHDR
jgi:hypothetical protein